MKKSIELSLFGILLAVVLSSSSGGYGGNRTGATGTTGCGGCHGSTTSIGTTIELDSAGIPVTSYVPGLSYTVKISATNNTGINLPKFGFQMSVVKLLNAGTATATQAGTWSTTLPTGAKNSGGTPVLIEQNQRVSPISGTGANGTVYSMSVGWTAPVTGTGSVKLYGLINAVNTSPGGADGGDKYQVATPVTITEAVVPPVASVSIATPTNTICAGTSVTFTATPTNGGATPSYQWRVGTTNVGTNSPTYTTTALTNGQVVTCVMTSNLSGVTGSPATSNSITMTVNPSVTPSVSIATASNTICAGTSVTFTATPTNGGTTPSYQWKVGTTNVGTNSSTYTTTSLTNGQTVSCVLTSSSGCASPTTATSNSISMTVNNAVTPTVSISITAGSNPACAGTPVTFTAAETNGGFSPVFAWFVNTTPVGTNSSSYTSSSLTSGQVVTCKLTSSASCASPVTVTSSGITMSITPTVTPTISISAPRTDICSGASITFTSSVTNGGINGHYDWYLNGVAVDSSVAYTVDTLTQSSTISCTLTSSATCASPVSVSSSNIQMTVHPLPFAAIYPSGPITICSGDSAPLMGVGGLHYQWSTGDTVTTLQVKQAGTYTLTATDANGCSAVAATPSVVSVSTVAIPTVSQSGNTLSSSTATTYQWYLNDSLIPSDTIQTITINQAGQYSVKVTDGTCSATSLRYLATLVGIYDIDPSMRVHLYPVPNRGSFVIESSTGTGDLQITDIYGKAVFNQKLHAAKQEVNATDLAPALYFVTVTEQGRSQTIKMEVTKE